LEITNETKTEIMITIKKLESDINTTRKLIDKKDYTNLNESELHCNLNLLVSVKKGLEKLELKLKHGLN
jgi:hypothetical protein